MKNQEHLLLLAAATCLFPFTSCGTQGNKKENDSRKLPNIIFYLADDMGIGDLGCYGQDKIQTPNIDRLAANGIRFTQHYSGSTVSAPSRCCLMTGKHTGHAHIRDNKRGIFIPDGEITVAELLKEKGYATGAFGKWGLGLEGSEGAPVRQGFDTFYGYLDQAAAHRYYPQTLIHDDEVEAVEGYSHHRIMEKGLEFIRSHADGPFFAYFPVTLPHADLDYPDISQYDGKFPETPFMGGSYKAQPKPHATYAAMVTEMDRNIGQIMELLEEKGIADNTIIIFTSDNGVHREGGNDITFFNSNGQYRGNKRDLYEGGVRTPFIVHWPAVIRGGRTSGHISAFWDFMPTVCDIAGIDCPETDGISYLPTLEGNEGRQKEHESIYYEYYGQGGKQSILKDGWKLVRLQISGKKVREELYHLPEDISEETDLAARYPEKVEELRQLMESSHTESPIFHWGNRQ